MQTKRCTCCGEIKPLTQFNKNKKNKDGLRYVCKTCCAAYKKAYKQTKEGKAKIKAGQDKYRQSDKGKQKHRERQASYRALQTPAVYKIECLKNGRAYIGSSVAPKDRQINHWSNLRRDAHNNVSLQEDYNLYGREAFTFTILQEASESDLRAIEQRYIDANPNGYNLQDALAY